jgi:amino acid transporter
MVYAMGHSRVLPRWFGSVHPRFGTPANAIIFMGAVGLMLALSGSFVWLAAMSTVVRLLVYVACIAALPRLHRSASNEDEVLELPGGYTIPVIAVLLSCWLVTHAPAQSWLITGIFMALGVVFYSVTRRAYNKTS